MTPEQKGISSRVLEDYLRFLNDNHIPMHNLLIARGEDIVLKTGWAPFDCAQIHRLYSDTKSLCALAVGFAIEDGYFTLDDTMEKLFPRDLEGQTDENVRKQTVRNMLMMATAGYGRSWKDGTDDRVLQYWQEKRPNSRPGGSFFQYDSSGTFVMGALVERVTGEKLLDYLRRKLFDPIGVSQDVRALYCPGGHTWSDSAFLMKPEDVYKVLRFCRQKGEWNGKQLLSRKYMEEATSNLIATDEPEGIEANGYGYYIWKAYGEGFFFNGMGSQYALAIPEKELYFVCNADTQGMKHMTDVILGGFYRDVVPTVTNEPLPEYPEAQASLARYASSMRLFAAYGEASSPIEQAISGRTFELAENPMGIERFTLTFGDKECAFDYKNAQGEKHLTFGRCANVFGEFPQDGYSDLVCGKPGSRRYRCAASAAWSAPTELWLKVQIIDDYYGNMDARFHFTPDGQLETLVMTRTAEAFLDEYVGEAKAR